MGPVAPTAGERSPTAASQGVSEDQTPQAYAEPISPATLRSFPHLSDLQGHVLLGGRTIQVVLSGIPANGSPDPWQVALVAAYVRRDGAWRPLEALGAMDLRTAGNGALYVPAGINLGLDAARGVALASIAYAPRGTASGAAGRLVNFRLDVARSVLTVQLDETSAAWGLRFRSLAASDIVGPRTAAGGSRYLLRYRQAEVAAVVAYRPFTAADSTAGIVLEPVREVEKAPGPSHEGFELLLGRAAAARLHGRLAALAACLQPEAAAGGEVAPPSCDAPPPPSASARLELTLPADDGGGNVVPHPVHVFDRSGLPATYTALYAGEAITLELPPNEALHLADTRPGRALQTGEPLRLSPGDARRVTLPRRVAGRLEVALDASAAAPVVVALQRLDAPRGDAYDLGAKTPAGVLRLGPTTFWVTVPRFTLPLLAGSYQVDARRGDTGGACTARVAVPGDGSGLARCELARGAAAKGSRGIELDLASGAWPMAGSAMRRALGLDWVATRAGEAGDARALPSLAVADPGTGLTLQYLPATPSLVAAWARASRAGRSVDVLARFAAFVRDAAGGGRGGLLELGCPTPGVDLAEYETLAQRLDVDAVRLFGCRDGLATPQLLALYGHLHARRQGKLLLTSVSSLDLAAVGPYFPRLVLHPGDAPAATAEGVLASLKAHPYTLSAGGLVHIGNLSEAKRKMGHRSLALDLDLAVSPDVRAHELIVYTEAGEVHRERLADGPPQIVRGRRLELEIPEGSRWIRAEIRGGPRRVAPGQLFDRSGGLLLSTTTFRALPK